MTLNLISADGHIDTNYMPDDVFYDAAPASLKERMPRFGVGRRALGVPGGPNWDRMAVTGFFDDVEKGIYRPADPDLRRKDMELDGIDAEVIYGILGLDDRYKDDHEALRFCYRTYAEWVTDFCKSKPNRFAAIAPLSAANTEELAEDVRYVAKLGLKGIELKPGMAVQNFWDESWEPVWVAAEETGIPVHFHSDVIKLRPQIASPEDWEKHRAVAFTLLGSMGKMANAQYLGTMILSGVLDRHPGLTLVMGECDLSWIPHFIARMDNMVVERGMTNGLSLLPSAYWYRQCYATFQSDPVGMDLVKHLGADNIMWGNDYPHSDGVWPVSQQVIKDQMSHLSEEDRLKITRDNAARVYGFDINN
jgi:predicted TIM-barrel fold metal-dependent hydrolase